MPNISTSTSIIRSKKSGYRPVIFRLEILPLFLAMTVERAQAAGIVYNGNFHATHMGFLEMALAVPRNIDPAFRLIGIPLEQVAIDGMDRYPCRFE